MARIGAGVSLITQALYVMVFITRYLDLFWVPPGNNMWNFVLKNFYILSSLYIIFLMMRVYARTREREKAWKFGAICMTGSVVAAPFIMMIFTAKWRWSFSEVREIDRSIAPMTDSRHRFYGPFQSS